MIAILNGRLETVGRIRPESMSLNLEERKSTATVTVGMDAPDIACGTWLRDETEPGKGIIWRVRSCETQYEKQTKSIQLEHIINTLRDVIIFGELTPQAISGTNSGNCTAKAAAQRVLAYQGTWALGDFEFAASNPYSFNGDDLYSAMETITRSLDGACWEYDLSKLPFRLHVRKLPNTPGCEMRMNRNIQTIRRTVDRSRMYTRFYPVGADNLRLAEGYVSRNERTYGVICKTETDQSKKTEGELRAWANERLRNHCEPSVTVQISGMDWSAATGESMDSLKINKLCRVPLPEWNTYIREKVTKLSWSDKIKEPKKVNVTLANLIEDVASIINNAAKASSRAGRSAAKKAEEDHAWFEDTTDHVAMVAEAVAGEGADKDWSRVASIVVDGNGIHQRVTKAEGEIVTHQTMIEMNEEEIALRAKTTDVEAMISVSEKGINLAIADAKGEAMSAIAVQKNRISAVVEDTSSGPVPKRAALILSINNGTSSAHLDANQVYIGNQKSTTVINGKCSLSDVTANYIESQLETVANVVVKKLTLSSNGYISLPTGDGNISITGSAASDFVRNLRITSSGNSYTLEKTTLGDASWQSVGSFSRAVSSWLVAGGSGRVNVTALPQNQQKSVPVSADGQRNISSNGQYVYKVYYENADGDDVETGASITVNVSVPNTISSWLVGGGGGYVNVTALPQNQQKSVLITVDGQRSVTTNGQYVYKAYYENADGDDVETGASITVNVAVPAEQHTHSFGVTRATWHSVSGTVAYGKLYYWDDDDESYSAVVNSNYYWYYSSTSVSGSTTVWY